MSFRHYMIAVFALLASATPISAQNTVDSAAVQALISLQKLDQRLHDVGYRLTTKNAPYCKEIQFSGGLLLHTIDQYGDKLSAKKAFGFDAPITISAVSGFNTRYVQPGDGLISINGFALSEVSLDDPVLAEEPPRYKRIAAVNRLLDAELELQSNFRNSNSFVTILRDQRELSVPLSPWRSCASRFEVKPDSKMEASADGKTVSISSALLEYTEGEDELAAIVAHELAHNILKHKELLNAQKVNRSFFGQFGKSAALIKETEIEADRLSIWLMVNAGYDPQAAIRFWTRYGKKHGKGIFSASTHYRWKKRVKLFQEEIAKIAIAAKDRNQRYEPPLLAQNANNRR